jgi:hypothetical protein
LERKEMVREAIILVLAIALVVAISLFGAEFKEKNDLRLELEVLKATAATTTEPCGHFIGGRFIATGLGNGPIGVYERSDKESNSDTLVFRRQK